MRSFTTLSAVVLAGVAAAQNVVQVQVGSSGTNPFIFSPNNVTASDGDVIMFTYSGAPGNHSVTQSSFTDPCDPLPDGFDSGNIFIPMGTTSGFPTWNLTITNASQPIWFFCKQLAPQPHCNVGMVGAINAPTSGTNTFDAFQSAAMNHMGNSGQGIGFLVGEGASASALPGPLSGSIIGFGLPNHTATSPPASSTPSDSTTTPAATSSSAATDTRASEIVVVLAAIFSLVLP